MKIRRLGAFLKVPRAASPKREVDERINDFREVEQSLPDATLHEQAARCMDCGVPFCHNGCPLGNPIPEWNDAAYQDDWEEAFTRLHEANNFPEITGRICPAPCEDVCVLNLQGTPVTIRQIEKRLADDVFQADRLTPRPAATRTGKRVAIVGSGPAGLACAQQLARQGHDVVVFERDDRIGGLLRYGIPDFKLEKGVLDRRIAQMRAEGVLFRTRVNVGDESFPAAKLLSEFDAVCLAPGALNARPLDIPGRELHGVHLAMDYLAQQNRVVAGDRVPGQIDARDKRVVILGGGDTGADCLGTAHRQRAREALHFHYRAEPTSSKDSSSHEEGGVRGWSLVAKSFEGDEHNRLVAVHMIRVEWNNGQMTELAGTEERIEAELALIAVGFQGTEEQPLLRDLQLVRNKRGTLDTSDQFATQIPHVYACGDATRGASLVVWAIAEGRKAASAIHDQLKGRKRLATIRSTEH